MVSSWQRENPKGKQPAMSINAALPNPWKAKIEAEDALYQQAHKQTDYNIDEFEVKNGIRAGRLTEWLQFSQTIGQVALVFWIERKTNTRMVTLLHGLTLDAHVEAIKKYNRHRARPAVPRRRAL